MELGGTGKHRIRVGAHQTDGTNDQDEDNRQHDCKFGDVLPGVIIPESTKWISHRATPFARQIVI
jgi:hypothetical protein